MLSVRTILPTLLVFWLTHGLQVHGQTEDSKAVELLFSDAVESYFEPIVETEILKLEIVGRALENYRNRLYQSVVVDVARLEDLQLPDGRQDGYHFMLAECYRKLDLPEMAETHYEEIVEKYSESGFRPEGLFRLQQLHYTSRNFDLADSLHEQFHDAYPSHPLAAASTHIALKSAIREQKWGITSGLFRGISPASPFHLPAAYLRGLALMHLDSLDTARDLLESTAQKAEDPGLRSECRLLLGAIAFRQGNPDEALAQYRMISDRTEQYPIARLRQAEVHISQKEYDKAVGLCRPLLKDPDYIFEASLLLLDSYTATRDTSRAALIRQRLSLFTRVARILFSAAEEKVLVENLDRQWANLISWDLGRSQGSHRASLESLRTKHKRKADDIAAGLTAIREEIAPSPEMLEKIQVSGYLEKKFLESVQTRLSAIEDSLEELGFRIEELNYSREQGDSLPARGFSSALGDRVDSLVAARDTLTLLEDELLQLAESNRQADAESQAIQAKFVDLGMIRYDRLKRTYQDLYREIGTLRQRRDLFVVKEEKQPSGENNP